jgi:hypothetical protein
MKTRTTDIPKVPPRRCRQDTAGAGWRFLSYQPQWRLLLVLPVVPAPRR